MALLARLWRSVSVSMASSRLAGHVYQLLMGRICFCKVKALQIQPKKSLGRFSVVRFRTDRKTSSQPKLTRPVFAGLMFLGTAEAHCAVKTQHDASETDQLGGLGR